VFVKLLLDENLSPAAAAPLAADGIDACHVRDRGILGASDHDVLERAYEEDRVLVTLAFGATNRSRSSARSLRCLLTTARWSTSCSGLPQMGR
jgi:predicted nuclease of predicted toxin-antitoxin system